MKIRTQVFFSQLPILVIIGLITCILIFFVTEIKNKSDLILVDNFKALSRMNRMHASLEDLNGLYPSPEASPEINKLRTQIEQQLLFQEENAKTPEEKKLTKTLQKQWKAYQKGYEDVEISAVPAGSRNGAISKKDGLLKEMKKTIEDINALNQKALIHTKEVLSLFISNILTLIIIGGVTSVIFGLYLSWFLSGLFLTPLNTMIEMIGQIGREEKRTLLHFEGSDEIEKLSNEFNLMAIRLQGYHKDSLQKAIEEDQMIKDALDAWPEPILILDEISNFTYVNKTSRLLLNLPHDLKKTPSLFHIKSDWGKALLKISETVMQTKTRTHPRKERDVLSFFVGNKKAFFLPWAYPIKRGTRQGRGGFEGVFMILQDLLHKPFSEARKADAYERLAHDFQTPLNEVRMAVHLCVEEAPGPLTEKQREILITAREKCDHLEKLSQSLLSLARSHHHKALHLQDVDLNAIVLDVIHAVHLEADQKKVFIAFESPPYLTPLHANSGDVKTVVGNLLRNAIHYATPGSEVKVSLGEVDTFIEFTVTNQGPLIPPEYKASIFKKNFKVPGQSKERAGLGLYIAKKIVHDMKGKIGFRSSEKSGTTFWVKFPVKVSDQEN